MWPWGSVWRSGREAGRKGAVPQAFPEVSPFDAKNDTSLAGASGPNCQLRQIVGHCVWQKPRFLSLQARWHLQQNTMCRGETSAPLCPIKLGCGFCREGIRQDMFLGGKKMCFISLSCLNQTENTYFWSRCWVSEGRLSVSHTHAF